jgi:alpha-methylacyl-CoA racemase
VQQPQAQARWPALREALTRIFKTRSRAEWCRLLEGTDVCFAPVLSMQEAMAHPHNVARGTFIEVGGVPQNAPAPRFSKTTPAAPRPGRLPGADTVAVLRDAGLSVHEIDRLKAAGALS